MVIDVAAIESVLPVRYTPADSLRVRSPSYRLHSACTSIDQIKKHTRCEIEDFVETRVGKLCVMLVYFHRAY